MSKSESLIDTLALERIEVNLFRGHAPKSDGPRIFGGLVIAQSLRAAYATVGQSLCHSLHCYFLRPGDPSVPILYEVDRARDGRSFTSRRGTAIQHGEQIFNLAGSFQHPRGGGRQPPGKPPAAEAREGGAAAADRDAAGGSAQLHGRQAVAADPERLDA